MGTETISVDEARRRGYLDAATARATSTAKPSPELRQALDAIKRKDSFLRLIRELLDDGRELRLECRFHDTRRWRFDLAALDVMVALEIDGGGYVHGRHHRPAGRDADNEKAAEAQRLGWNVLRVAWEHVHGGQALELFRQFAAERGGHTERKTVRRVTLASLSDEVREIREELAETQQLRSGPTAAYLPAVVTEAAAAEIKAEVGVSSDRVEADLEESAIAAGRCCAAGEAELDDQVEVEGGGDD
jgi:very-short-patch-repair endonuclease